MTVVEGKLLRNSKGEIYCLDLFVEQELQFCFELLKGPSGSNVYVASINDQKDSSRRNYYLIIANFKGEKLFRISQEDMNFLKSRIGNWRCSNANSRSFRIEFVDQSSRQATLL